MAEVINLAAGVPSDPPLISAAKLFPSPEKMSASLAFSMAQKDMELLCLLLGLDKVIEPTKRDMELLGRELVRRPGYRFRLGKRLLQHASADGKIWPTEGYRLSREVTPTAADHDYDVLLEDWVVDLEQRGSQPAQWRVYGYLVGDPVGADVVQGERLLGMTPDKSWVLVDNFGWLRLGNFTGGYVS
jgi:hypothetical protein